LAVLIAAADTRPATRPTVITASRGIRSRNDPWLNFRGRLDIVAGPKQVQSDHADTGSPAPRPEVWISGDDARKQTTQHHRRPQAITVLRVARWTPAGPVKKIPEEPGCQVITMQATQRENKTS
jgi:hypothetical protein